MNETQNTQPAQVNLASQSGGENLAQMVNTQPVGSGAGEIQGASQNPTPPPPPKRSLPIKKMLVILISLLTLVGVVYLAYIYLSKSVKSTVSETTITWWGLWEADAAVSSIISDYEAANPGIKINYMMQSKEDYRERLTSALARGDGPDIFRFHNTWVPMFVNDLEPMPATVMSAAEYAQTFYPVASSDLSNGTNIVGIPLMYDGLGLYINDDIFETYGKTTPKTWSDLRDTAIALTVKDENGRIKQAGVALGRTENVDHFPEILSLMMMQNGVKMTNPTGEQAEAAVKYFSLFNTVDKVWDETMPPSTVSFASGKLAMYFGPSWRVHEIRQQNPSLKFKVVPVPQLPKDSPSELDINLASYWAEGVWAKSKNKDEAWKFLKYLSQKDTLEKFYTAAKLLRAFGEPYPRVDMQNTLLTDPYVGAIVAEAPTAKSWYMVSRTFDGPTGINSQLNSYFEDAVNAVNSGDEVKKALETAAAGVNQVLSTYGLISRTTTSTQ